MAGGERHHNDDVFLSTGKREKNGNLVPASDDLGVERSPAGRRLHDHVRAVARTDTSSSRIDVFTFRAAGTTV